MSIPKPPEPPDYESKPLSQPSTGDKPNLKDFDDEANWRQSPTNPAIEINIITGRLRTKDFTKPGVYPKSI